MKNIIALICLTCLLLVGCGSQQSNNESNNTMPRTNLTKQALEQQIMQTEGITFRFVDIRSEIGEDRAIKLYKLLKHSRDVISAWQYGVSGRKGKGFDLNSIIVRNYLEKDHKLFQELFKIELKNIEEKTDGTWDRFKYEDDEMVNNWLTDYDSVIWDINNAYISAIEYLVTVPDLKTLKEETNQDVFTHTIAASTTIEKSRDIFDRYITYLFSEKITQKDFKAM